MKSESGPLNVENILELTGMISCEMFCGNFEYRLVYNDTLFDALGEPGLQSTQETGRRALQKMRRVTEQ